MVFLFTLLALFLIVILLIFSKIEIKIMDLIYDSNNGKNNYIDKDYKIKIKLYILNKIPIMNFSITNEKLKKWKVKEKIKQELKNIDKKLIKNINKVDKDIIKVINNIDLKIKDINLKIELGTESAYLTSLLIPVISTIIAFFINKKIEKYKTETFMVKPIFQNRNTIKISLFGIFELKTYHIINAILIISKERKKTKEYAISQKKYSISAQTN